MMLRAAECLLTATECFLNASERLLIATECFWVLLGLHPLMFNSQVFNARRSCSTNDR